MLHRKDADFRDVRRITPDQRHKEITREEFSRQVVSLSNSLAFRDERVLDRIAAAVAATGSHRVLDLACGPGLVSRRLARASGAVFMSAVAPGSRS